MTHVRTLCERVLVTSPEPDEVRAALARRLKRRAIVAGSIALPAVPAMLEEYVVLCLDTFAALGVTFSEEEIAHLREVLRGQLLTAFAESPRSQIVISYDSPVGTVVNYRVAAEWSSVDDAYAIWMDTREAPYFGTSADARVMELAREAGRPADVPILDIGAGTGRNALALARQGHPVDAIEMTHRFAEEIRATAAQEDLIVRVFEADMFDEVEGLRDDYRLVILSEVVTDFRTTSDLRRMFAIAARHLGDGGHLVFNAFVCAETFDPDLAVRQFGQQAYSTVFTYAEIASAVAGTPLQLVSDVSTYDFEKAHLPPEYWPPTGWFEGWARGLDVLDVPADESPLELRWLVYAKTPPSGSSV